jgi:hypothetical protein
VSLPRFRTGLAGRGKGSADQQEEKGLLLLNLALGGSHLTQQLKRVSWRLREGSHLTQQIGKGELYGKQR